MVKSIESVPPAPSSTPMFSVIVPACVPAVPAKKRASGGDIRVGGRERSRKARLAGGERAPETCAVIVRESVESASMAVTSKASESPLSTVVAKSG